MKKHIFFFFLSLYLLTMGGHFYSNDHYTMYLVTRNIVEKQSLEIPESHFFIKTSEGKFYSWYELGQSILALPFYAAGKFADTIFRTDFLTQFFVASQNTFFAAGACLLLFMIATKLKFAYYFALILAFLYGIGTMAWVYSANFFAGTPAAFLLLLSFYLLLLWEERSSRKYLLLCSLSCGFLFFTRILMLPATFWFMFYIAYKDRKNKKSLLSDLLLFLIPVAFFIALILYHNWFRFGIIAIDARFLIPSSYTPWEQALEKSYTGAFYRILFAAETGLFFFNPVLIFFLAGLMRVKKDKRLLLAAAIVLQTIISLVLLKRIDGRWCWGTRFLMPVLPFVALFAALFLKENKNKILACAFYALFFISAAFQLSSVITDPMNYFLRPLHNNQVVHQLKQAGNILTKPSPHIGSDYTHAQVWRARRYSGLDFWFLNLRAMGIKARYWLTSVLLLIFMNLFSAAKLFGHISFSHREEK